jgi:hypothetical protein
MPVIASLQLAPADTSSTPLCAVGQFAARHHHVSRQELQAVVQSDEFAESRRIAATLSIVDERSHSHSTTSNPLRPWKRIPSEISTRLSAEDVDVSELTILCLTTVYRHVTFLPPTLLELLRENAIDGGRRGHVIVLPLGSYSADSVVRLQESYSDLRPG